MGSNRSIVYPQKGFESAAHSDMVAVSEAATINENPASVASGTSNERATVMPTPAVPKVNTSRKSEGVRSASARVNELSKSARTKDPEASNISCAVRLSGFKP